MAVPTAAAVARRPGRRWSARASGRPGRRRLGRVDVRNSDDLFRARILAAVHAKESDNISRRVRRKRQELAERGCPHGGPRRYGCRVDFSAIEPAEATIIQQLADRTLAGESLASLCRELTIRGIPTAAGGRWSPATCATHPDRTPPRWPPRIQGTAVSGRMAGHPLRGHPHALRMLLTDPQTQDQPDAAHRASMERIAGLADTAACACTPTTGKPSVGRSRHRAAIASSAAAGDSRVPLNPSNLP